MTNDRMAAEQAAEARIVAWLREHGVDADASADDAVPALSAALARADMRSDALLDDLCLTAHALRRVEQERDALVKVLADLFDWSDRSYLHAVMHVENAVRNLRADLSVAEQDAATLRRELADIDAALDGLYQSDSNRVAWIKATQENIATAERQLAEVREDLREAIVSMSLSNYSTAEAAISHALAALTRTEDR